MSTAYQPYINYGSGILREAIKITACKKNEASHFAICRGSNVKFVVRLRHGIPYLQKTVAAYNKKLALLLRCLPFIPPSILHHAGLGYYSRISLHPFLKPILPSRNDWNVLVGTYDSSQKIVFQCFSEQNKTCLFVKVGNKGSAEQMEKEIRFLQKARDFESFSIPKLKHAELISEGAPFNIQVTDEFEGEKIPPVLNKEIYQIAKEIAGEPTLIDGIPHTFSHGDFAPWNIRKKGSSYTVFDWEHCKLRPEGYDIAYFVIVSEIALHSRKFDDAFCIAIEQIRQFDSDFQIDKQLLRQEFEKSVKNLCF